MGLEQQQQNFFVDKVVSDQDVRFKELSDRLSFLEAQESAAAVSVAILEDQKAQNTLGGTFTSGADRTRDLNAEQDPDGIVSLASNEFTLGSGTYLIDWSAPGYACALHQSMLYSVSGGAILKRGQPAFSSTVAPSEVDWSNGTYIVTITSNTVYSIRHRCQTTRVTDGFGLAGNFGTEIYTRVVITKIR